MYMYSEFFLFSRIGLKDILHASEPLYSNSAVIAWWLQLTSAHNSVPEDKPNALKRDSIYNIDMLF